MPRFLIDEDMPRSTAGLLRGRGHEVLDVRDCGLRGASDAKVYRFAQAQQAVLVTADRGFGNVLVYPPGTHCGIVVLHCPNEMPVVQSNAVLLRALASLAEGDYAGALVVVDPGKVRVRRCRTP